MTRARRAAAAAAIAALTIGCGPSPAPPPQSLPQPSSQQLPPPRPAAGARASVPTVEAGGAGDRRTDPPPADPGAALADAAAPPEAILQARRPSLPVAGIGAAALHDTFGDARSARRHEALDIAAPRGTPVHAVDDGPVAKLFTSVPGGLTVYQFDPSGRLAYYYAHLDRYADGLKEGVVLRRCDVIGFVGSTGNAAADAPHLHFAVFRLGPERRWWQGDPVNPYAALVAAGGRTCRH